jgi:sec-independent protein translocase protein TatA
MRITTAQILSIIVALCITTTTTVFSFAPPQNQFQRSIGVCINQLPSYSVATSTKRTPLDVPNSALDRQRRSVANVQLMGLFGLGAPEIAVILVAAAFLLGPQKLAELGKDAGKIAGELKEVPKEFQAGLKEGEQAAQMAKQQQQQQTIPEATIEEKKE